MLGDGCVYPASANTLPDELTAKQPPGRRTSRGSATVRPGQPKTCRFPAHGADPDHLPRPGDPYVTWRNPFVYFHSVSHRLREDDVGLD